MTASFAGRLLRATRIRADLTQRALARAAGVPESTVARIERGKVSPRIDTFVKLLDAAGATTALEAFIDLDKGRPEIREMLELTPTQRVEHLMAEVRCMHILQKTVGRIRRVSGELGSAGT